MSIIIRARINRFIGRKAPRRKLTPSLLRSRIRHGKIIIV